MSEPKAGGQPSLLPEWAWNGLGGVIVALGLVMITYRVSTDQWASAAWTGLFTVGVAALFLRRLRRRNTVTRPTADSVGAPPAALSWDDPRLMRGAAIVVLVSVSVGLFGVAAMVRGAGLGPAPSEQGRWILLISGPILTFLGFATSARVIRRWHTRAVDHPRSPSA